MNRSIRSMMRGLLLIAGALAVPGMAPVRAQTSDGAQAASSQAELIFWQSVADSRDRAQYEAYLAAFPQGLFAGLARVRIAALPSVTLEPSRNGMPVLPAAQTQARQESVPLIAAAPAADATPALVSAASAVSGTLSSPAGGSPSPLGTDPAPALPVPVLDAAFVEQLQTMAFAQGSRHQIGSVVLPARPNLPILEPLELPPQFCSERHRNAFHDIRFKAAIDRASEANAIAIAHMELLGRMFEQARARGDNNASNTLAQESKSYEPIAQAAFLARSALDPVFGRIMAIPLVPCEGAAP